MTEVVAEVPAQVATTDAVVEAPVAEVPAVSEPTVTEVVAEVPAQVATTDVVSDAPTEEVAE